VDEADVSQVILRYADGLDRRNFDQVWACFAPDAEVVGSAFSGPLRDYLPRLLEGVQTFGATQHFMGNQLRSVDGDHAHTETYAIAHHFHDPAGEKEAIVMGVRYVDDLARQPDGGWLITHRHATAMWTRRA
jgi:ketosteroid isomerase-like protein